MTAVDTNVLVRFLTEDEPKQAAAARSLFARESIWVAKTVLLETGWVLRSTYGYDATAVRESLTKLLGLENVHAEDERAVAEALALTEHGVGFADAMHLTSRAPGDKFVTFDEVFVRSAKRAGVTEIASIRGK